MGVSQFGESVLVDAITGVNPLPTSLYLALSSQVPLPSESSNALGEPDGSYERQLLDPGNWGPGENGASVYTQAVQFPTSTTLWPTINCWVLTTSLTGGQNIVWGELDTPLQVVVGQLVTIPAESFGLSVISAEDLD